MLSFGGYEGEIEQTLDLALSLEEFTELVTRSGGVLELPDTV